jgi:glycosyltransferase involved in cell wall biosynthesis
MNILHVIPSVALKHGGPTEAILGMVRALREEGVDARIVSTDDDVTGRLIVPLDQWISYQGLPTYFVRRIASRHHTLVGFTLAPGLVRSLWREIPQYDFIHVHTVFSFPASIAMAISRIRKKPYAVRPMGHLARWSLRIRPRIKQLQLSILGRQNLNAAAFLHATSSLEAQEAATLQLRCPIKVVPLAAMLPSFVEDAPKRLRQRLSIGNARPIALFLSRLHEKKGLEFLLRALGDGSATNIELVICGDGDPSYVQSLRRLAEELGVASRIHWLGFLHGLRKWEVVQGCDFFVLPSFSENFGIAVVEALACGLFVIVSPDIGIASDLSRSGIGRIVSRDPSELARAMAECATNEKFDASARSMRRDFFERRFSWKSTALQLIAAYREALRD